MDDSLSVTLSVVARDAATAWPSKTLHPEIYLQCREHKLNTWFVTGASFNVEGNHLNHATIRFGFDNGVAFSQVWRQSTDKQAAGTPSIDFVKKIAAAKRLVVQWTPFNSSVQTVEFDLSGFDAVKAPLEGTCRVKL
jgi:hypothetical protein